VVGDGGRACGAFSALAAYQAQEQLGSGAPRKGAVVRAGSSSTSASTTAMPTPTRYSWGSRRPSPRANEQGGGGRHVHALGYHA